MVSGPISTRRNPSPASPGFGPLPTPGYNVLVEQAHLKGHIERLIAEYLQSDDERFEWVRNAVRRFGFLPLYLGWVSTLGIRPDGSMVRWDHEDDPEVIKELDDSFWSRTALALGARKFPELAQLVPNKPPDGLTCDMCAGEGIVRGAGDLICRCGGLGWIVPGEQAEPGPG